MTSHIAQRPERHASPRKRIPIVLAAAALCLPAFSSAVAQTIPTSYSWTSTGPIIGAQSDATHSMIAVKDPSAVRYNGQWIVYASDVNSAGNYNMEYLHFADWSEASAATPYFLDDNPNLAGYHTAPQVFYFAPQNLWYLIFQSGQPQFSTNSDPTQPQNWTAPTNFFASMPASVSAWLDFWIICDSANCYLFFCGDNGNFYRSSTPIGNFPNGFSEPVIAYSETNQDNLFEADNVYSVEGTGQYLAIIECIGGPDGHRFFRALTASSLDGAWTPLGDTLDFATPFLGMGNVTFEPGVSAWTDDFSSGGALIDGNDQTDPIDIDNLQFLYQGDMPNNGASNYNLIPWQLGLATSNANSPTFLLSNSGNINLVQGAISGNTSTISVTPIGGFSGTVGLTCSVSSPAGATSPTTCSLVSPSVASGSGSDLLTVTTTSTTTAGTYTITVTGTSGAIAVITTVAVNVTAPPVPSFALSNSGAMAVIPGATTGNTSTVTVTPSGGFTGAVAMSCDLTTSPAGAVDLPACSLATASVTISGTTAQTDVLTVGTTAATTALNKPAHSFWPSTGGAVLALVVFFGIPARRRKWLSMLGLLVFLVSIASTGCGGSGSGGGGGGMQNPGTTVGAYTFTVTGTPTSGTAETTIVTLTVN